MLINLKGIGKAYKFHVYYFQTITHYCIILRSKSETVIITYSKFTFFFFFNTYTCPPDSLLTRRQFAKRLKYIGGSVGCILDFGCFSLLTTRITYNNVKNNQNFLNKYFNHLLSCQAPSLHRCDRLRIQEYYINVNRFIIVIVNNNDNNKK